MFKDCGISNKVVIDGAREQVIRGFNKTYNDASIEVQQLEFGTP